jgi:hypothetical protein
MQQEKWLQRAYSSGGSASFSEKGTEDATLKVSMLLILELRKDPEENLIH